MHKRICILGSTGSIGASSLAVVESLPDQFAVRSLAANRDWRRMAEQVRKFHPAVVAMGDGEAGKRLEQELAGSGVKVLAGPDGLIELATDPEADLVICAVVGVAGLPATLAAVEQGKTVALANKESLVVGGELIMAALDRCNATLLPIDSEHSAVFQAIRAGQPHEVRRVILTASGGPFRTWPIERIENATVAEALNHPTWQMGPKITVDSASLMNKALEVIEASFLFGLPAEQIEVLVHPESMIHSMVEFVDGSVIAQMGPTDMRSPIQFALTWPRRVDSVSGRLDLATLRRLNFEPPDHRRFPSLELGYRVVRARGDSGAVLNGANEQAVAAFLAGRIPFGRIVPLVRRALDEHNTTAGPTLAQLQSSDRWAREQVNSWIG